ncbi:putative Late endosome to vacuole transport-related protein [Rhodotorula toruloides ATCC 204091]|uniref:Putative late endosome to vacuole transport-related protein n=1 Tax=Rhodotorula toruloides TaxID=5286 RepID=A0A2T0AEC4_RHOTO|nr:putative Late endosome to vacuole transport-related protein [Rhodotorula toruloides ATCC 204091]PRQ76366.1 putative late endosome to vacuole transport-related protein [Rhodotorula toruloides]
MTSPPPDSASPDPPASPPALADSQRQPKTPTHSDDSRLRDVLDSPTKSAHAQDEVEVEGEDEFGEFVYSGKDRVEGEMEEREEGSYERRMEELVGASVVSDGDGDATASEAGTARGGAVDDKQDEEEHHSLAKEAVNGALRGLGNGLSTPASPAVSRVTSASNDEFPALRQLRGGPSRARSSLGSLASMPDSPSQTPQRPSFHPTFSRLRSISTQSFPSKNRFVSSSTYNTALEYPYDTGNPPRRPPLAGGISASPSTSNLDNISRRSSYTNLFDLPSTSDLPTGTSASNASSAGRANGTSPPARTVKWSSLKRISARVYPQSGATAGAAALSQAEQIAKSAMGQPTVMAVSGLIAIGTTKGWVLVFDFGQNLRCVCGTEGNAKEAGAVTALAVSQDHTFVAVGHENGSIHLYSLLKPSQPQRSVAAVTLPQVLTGRKEGHLIGSKICHLGFVGARHTAIVSSDDKGLAFYHALGKVLMLASTDIIRMLGRYPDPAAVLSSGAPPIRPPLPTAATAPPNALHASPPDSPRPASPASPSLPASTPKSPSFPRPPRPATSSAGKKPSVVLDMAPLPLGPAPHPSTDTLSLVALLTPTKLVIVGLKPAPRTWWRVQFPREWNEEKQGEGQEKEEVERGYAVTGVLAWWPSARRSKSDGEEKEVGQTKKEKADAEAGEDPVLAWAWGARVRLVRVRGAVGAPQPPRRPGVSALKPAPPPAEVRFEELEGWTCDGPVLALRWYNERVVVVLTAAHFDVFDLVTRQRIGRDAHNIRSIVSSDLYASAFDSTFSLEETLAYSASFMTFKRKLFLLSYGDVRAGAVLSWADRILALMQPATILKAIDTTTGYLEGQVDASTIALPDNPAERRAILEPKLREILNASLGFVFSEDRLRDGSHADGETIQQLFEGLVGTCVRACLALGDPDWLFDELYERYEQNGIEGIFLERIEPYVLAGAMHALPPSVTQRLIAVHSDRRQFDAVERIVLRVDPLNLDLNQVLSLCQREKLYDPLIHVYTRALHDYVGPLVELIALVRQIQQHRLRRPRTIETADSTFSDDGGSDGGFPADVWGTAGRAERDVEEMVPAAYKVFAYLSSVLKGFAYPTASQLSPEEGERARAAVYGFLLSGQTRSWPAKGGRSVLTVDEEAEPTYPYLRLLLSFDAEALLDTLDQAFEDPFLDGEQGGTTFTRQRIVDLLLEVMSPASSESSGFSSSDTTFLDIFIARNLPKYPQYLRLSDTTLRDILIRLAGDFDLSTTEDRQLAAEYLLSAYTPSDFDTLVPLFEQAGFFRILRSLYRTQRKWAALASTYLEDPDTSSDVFGFLRETFRLAERALKAQKAELANVVLDAVPTLIDVDEDGLQQTAALVNTFLPHLHDKVVERLSSVPWREFAYLRCLCEPAVAGVDLSATSSNLDDRFRHRYLQLLCTHEPQQVIRYLERDASRLAQDGRILEICEEAGALDAVVWALDRRGETEAALVQADEALEARTDKLLEGLLRGNDEEDGEDGHAQQLPDLLVEQIVAISAAATAVCARRTSTRRRPKDVPPEELWFRHLSSLVSTVRAIRSVAPAPPRPSDRSSAHRRISGASIIVHDSEPQQLSPHASDLLSLLIPNALSSLVSTTSSHEVSFPRLVRRLIEANSRSPAANRSYAEFKGIVSSMLDSYAFEGDLLGLSSSISAEDLFKHVVEFKAERDRGWRPGAGNPGGLCAECLQPVWGPQGTGSSPPMSRSASVSMVVEAMGMNERPRMKKRPSLKGKEVDWPEAPATSRRGGNGGFGGAGMQVSEPPRGVVVGRDGRLFHQTCHLLRSEYDGGF